jgi:hypothetical protein
VLLMPGAAGSGRPPALAARVDLDQLLELRHSRRCGPAFGCWSSAERTAGGAAASVPGARPLLLTARLAALHLERLRRAAYDPFDPRVIATAPFDVWRLLGTTITGRF